MTEATLWRKRMLERRNEFRQREGRIESMQATRQREIGNGLRWKERQQGYPWLAKKRRDLSFIEVGSWVHSQSSRLRDCRLKTILPQRDTLPCPPRNRCTIRLTMLGTIPPDLSASQRVRPASASDNWAKFCGIAVPVLFRCSPTR